MHKTDQRSFHVEELTRVEGEGALDVVVDGSEIVDTMMAERRMSRKSRSESISSQSSKNKPMPKESSG